MAVTLQELGEWFDRGVEQGASRMIVICDTFDHEDYPHFVKAGEDAATIAREEYGHPGAKNMQRVMECYDLTKSKEDQLAQERVYNW